MHVCMLNLRVSDLSHSKKETMVRRFDHKGLRQLQNLLYFSTFYLYLVLFYVSYKKFC